MTYRRGEGSGGAGGVIAPPIFIEIGKILAFSTPSIPRLNEGIALTNL